MSTVDKVKTEFVSTVFDELNEKDSLAGAYYNNDPLSKDNESRFIQIWELEGDPLVFDAIPDKWQNTNYIVDDIEDDWYYFEVNNVIKNNEDIYMNVSLSAPFRYDKEEIESLQIGDQLRLQGAHKTVLIETLEIDEWEFNGVQNKSIEIYDDLGDSYYLITDSRGSSNCYLESSEEYLDIISLGTVIIPLSEKVVLMDASSEPGADPEIYKGKAEVADFFANRANEEILGEQIITIKNSEIKEIEIDWIP